MRIINYQGPVPRYWTGSEWSTDRDLAADYPTLKKVNAERRRIKQGDKTIKTAVHTGSKP